MKTSLGLYITNMRNFQFPRVQALKHTSDKSLELRRYTNWTKEKKEISF